MMRLDKQSVERAGWMAGGGLAAATLLGFLGRFFWLFDLFSHFRVQLFQVTLVLILIAAWRRSHQQLIAFVLLACLNYAVVLPLYFGKPPAPTEKPARAVLMNICSSNGHADQVLAFIRQYDPDLLVLQEVTPEWAAELDPLDYPHRLADVCDGCFGMMLMSRYPLSDTNIVFAGSAGVPTLTATAHLPQGEIAVIGTHPLPPVSAAYSSHRNAQLAALPELVLAQQKPVLLLGDLNTSPWSSHFTSLLKQSGLKNSMKGFGFQPSWPAGNRLLRIPIDHVLHSPDIRIHQRVTGPSSGSDHLPVLVEFTVR